MNPQTLKYLQKDQIGKVIATGLAELYMNKPSKPVKYLAEWLKQYSNNQKQMKRLVEKQKQKTNIVRAYETMEHANARRQQEKLAKQQNQRKHINDFKKLITEHEYHQDLLLETLPQFIQKSIDFTGVYVAELNHPSKQVKQEDTDELAHLDTAADKVLNYFGSSVSHKQLVRGKTLKTTQGVTANSFSLLEQTQAPVVGEDGKQIPQPPKPKYVFVSNVVKNQSIHYFKIPKLGSYLAVPVICNEYLSEANFDSALKQKQQYIKQCQDLETAKKAELQQLQKQKQQLQKKINDLVQKNAQQSQLEPLKVQLKQVEEAIVQKQKQSIQQKQPELNAQKKKYVICTDTLGKDKVISENQINLVTEIIEHFRESWQNKQKQLLKKDIDFHISNLKNIKQEEDSLKQALKNSLQLNEDEQKQVAAITQQNKKNHHQLQLQVSKLKSFLKENETYLKSFLNLANLRVPKYKQLIQAMLYFIGLNKQAVNEVNRTTLNWRQVRKKYINAETFNKVLDFKSIGPKQSNFLSYWKTPYLVDIFDKFDEEQIYKYNFGLGGLLEFIKKALELRQLDVEIRKSKFEADKKQLARVSQQNQKINTKLVEQLEKHKAALSGQDAQKFNQEQWKAEFYTKQPLLNVPAEPIEDKDNDM